MADTGKIVALIKALAPVADPAVIEAAVSDWLDEHGVVIADGSITEEKLAESLSAILARVDGYYEQMTVGNAEQLVSTVGVEDKVPYLFRTSGGSADIGDREVDMVVGGTIAWNQRVQNPTVWQYSTKAFPSGMSFVAGHKMLAIFKGNKVDSEGAQPKLYYYAKVSSDDVEQREVLLTFGENIISLNKTMTANGNASGDGAVWLYIDNISNAANLIVNFFDLTQMFGSTIADYIYALETANAGAGVAWFRKYFNKLMYQYNPGELMSVQTSAHRMVGFNAWDEVWELGRLNYDKTSPTWGQNVSTDNQIRSKNYIPVVPNATYHCTGATGSTIYAIFYGADKNPVEYNNSGYGSVANANFITPSNAHFMRFYVQGATTYANDICINLSWDGERDGEYEPYSVHSYALDSDLILRGIPKLDANNALFYDGDTYESDGTVTRRYGSVDLGTLYWSTGFGGFYTNGIANAIKAISGDNPNASRVCCARYTVPNNADVTNFDKIVFVNGSQSYLGFVIIKDSAYNDAATFKASIQGLYLVYELATPTTESADPYSNPQIVDDFGTEEYVDAAATAQTNPRDVAIPVGHETKYQNNLRAKLEMSPESPSGDGDYIVRQTNGQNAYVPLSFPADELPAVPTTDGDYRLKCTVADGSATFTWEAIE